MNKNKFNWFTLLNWIGGALILVGLIIAYRLCDNFVVYAHKGLHFEVKSGLHDLGAVLSGTVGVLFLLASVLFFTFTLYQTRKEMQDTHKVMDEQRSIMEKQAILLQDQQNQATFHNLLSHHAAVIETLSLNNNSDGQEGLKSLYKLVQENLFYYESYIRSSAFPAFSTTYYHPLYEFGQNKSQLDRYIGSFATIIRFVSKNFEDKALYFDITSNYLSLQERYIIGMYVQVYRNPNSDFIRDCGFDFLEYQRSIHLLVRYWIEWNSQ